MNALLKDMTRPRLIQIWFTAVLLVVVAGIALGVSLTLGTGAILVALCLVPPVIIVMLWPDSQRRTVAEVIYDAENPRTDARP